MPYVNNVNAQHNEIAGTKCHKINDISKEIFFCFLCLICGYSLV